jgi:hypothetical protein
MTAVCHTCTRVLTAGESAWADDWTVLDGTGSARREVRYTCDDCALACPDCHDSLATCSGINAAVNEWAVLAAREEAEEES